MMSVHRRILLQKSARSQMKNFLFEQAAQTPDPLCVKFLMLDASASMRNEVSRISVKLKLTSAVY
jgi:hypothetical protein